jgi:hypothetical protein
MVALRIFSYLPNPRIWKATITARLCSVEVEVRGASPRELSQWLWDFDARPIADLPREMLASTERTGRIGFADRRLYKTAAFLEAQPFGTVPAAFSLEQALAPQRTFLVGDDVTLADICFVAELCLFHNERARSSVLKTAGLSPLLDDEFTKNYPRSATHFERLLAHPAFVPDVAGYLDKIEKSGARIN